MTRVRILAVALAAALPVVACGGTDTGSGASDQAETAPATTPATTARELVATTGPMAGSGSTTVGDSRATGPTIAPTTTGEPTTSMPEPGATGPSVPGSGAVRCTGQDPEVLGFDPFYDQHCDAAGIPVLASDAVDPRAVEAAAAIVVAMVGHRPDLIEAMADDELRVGVMADTEATTDLPEYRDLDRLYPETDWDARTRGLGATRSIPLASAAEENLLCLPSDVYQGQSILVHEFAHTIHLLGLVRVDPDFAGRLSAAYLGATADGRWANTYAGTNPEEYFATGVQSWFGTAQEGPPDGDGIYNDIDTRSELARYDPELHALVAETFRPDPLPLCRS